MLKCKKCDCDFITRITHNTDESCKPIEIDSNLSLVNTATAGKSSANENKEFVITLRSYKNERRQNDRGSGNA